MWPVYITIYVYCHCVVSALSTESSQQQSEQHGGSERLTMLHTRLQNEAEKIRKWKTHTEMELKQKVAICAQVILQHLPFTTASLVTWLMNIAELHYKCVNNPKKAKCVLKWICDLYYYVTAPLYLYICRREKYWMPTKL